MILFKKGEHKLVKERARKALHKLREFVDERLNVDVNPEVSWAKYGFSSESPVHKHARLVSEIANWIEKINEAKIEHTSEERVSVEAPLPYQIELKRLGEGDVLILGHGFMAKISGEKIHVEPMAFARGEAYGPTIHLVVVKKDGKIYLLRLP